MATLDRADVVAESLLAFWTRRQTLELSTRQLCARLAQAVDPAGALADAAYEDLDRAIPQISATLRAAVVRDGEVAAIAQRLAPLSPPPHRSAAPCPENEDGGDPGLAIRCDRATAGTPRSGGAGRLAPPAGHPRPSGKQPGGCDAPATKADTILVVSADPSNLQRLRLQHEEREIRETLALSTARDRWVVNPRGSVRLRDITRALLQLGPRVVHFSGHGSIEDGVFLEDQTGESHRIPRDALAELFRCFGQPVECVVLNACFSEQQARSIARHVPFVVGTPDQIPDTAAIEFSVGFYTALGEGRGIPEAHALGCIHFKSAQDEGLPPPVLVQSAAIPFSG